MVNACFTGVEWLGPIQLCSARQSLSVGHVIVSVTAEDCQYNNMTFKRYDVDRIDCTIVSIVYWKIFVQKWNGFTHKNGPSHMLF